MFKFLGKLLDSNERELNRLQPIIEETNSLEKETKKLKKAQFRKETEILRKRLVKGESLDDLLPKAFALAREASVRTIG